MVTEIFIFTPLRQGRTLCCDTRPDLSNHCHTGPLHLVSEGDETNHEEQEVTHDVPR